MTRLCAVVLVLIVLSGCSTSTRFNVDVASMADESITGCCKFVIVSSDEQNIYKPSLEWRRFESQLAKALEMEGFEHVSKLADADIAIIAQVSASRQRRFEVAAIKFRQMGRARGDPALDVAEENFASTPSRLLLRGYSP